jgi:hypothetical protein
MTWLRRPGVVALAALAALATACGVEPGARVPRPEAPKLFLAGDGELWVVDVAAERVRHLRMAQLTPGDPPVRILRRGDRLAVWGYDTWLLDPDRPRRRPVRLVRGSWFFIASPHADRLWIALVDPTSPATVRGLRAVREVTVKGEVTVPDTRPPGGRWPQLAVADGLLLGSRRGGWFLWEPATHRVVRRWAERELGYPGAAHGDLVASCPEPCTSLLLTDARTGAQRRVPAPGGLRFQMADGAFSPAGDTLAVPVQRRGSTDSAARLALVDVARDRVRVVSGSRVAPGYTYARWGRTGGHVFLTGGRRVIVAYRLGDARARRLAVRVGDFYDAAAY